MATKKTVLDTHNIVTAIELADILNTQLDAMDKDPNVIRTLPPPFVHGSPGCGKSSIIRSVAEKRNIDFIDTRLAEIEPADIKGLPVPNRERKCMDWYTNGAWPRDPHVSFVPVRDENDTVTHYDVKFADDNNRPQLVEASYKNGTLKFKINAQNVKNFNDKISICVDDERRNDTSMHFIHVNGSIYEGVIETTAAVDVDIHTSGIILLDEMSSACKDVQVASYELVLDRRLGKEYKVPPGYLIVAAGNNTTDRAVATTMSSALANRFMHVEMREDAEAWLTWARSNNLHPAVVGFITYKPNMLFNMEGENLERGWPSPRSWERVSQMCHIYNSSAETLLRKMVYGLVGNGAGVEFMEFYKINAKFANVLDYMRDPKLDVKKIIPEAADQKYALCSAMTYLIWRGQDQAEENKRVDGFFRICCELTSDFAAMALLASINNTDKMITKKHAGTLLKHPRFKDWQKKHGTALSKGLDLTKLFQ